MTFQKKIEHEFMGTFGREIWAILRGETAPNEPNFLNWLKTHTKVINAQNKCVSYHFGGMLALKSGLRFLVSASEVPFFYGHFCQKCPFSTGKK